MAVRFGLRVHGTSFATRGRGEELREELIRASDDTGQVTVDLTGVQHMSYSFADEFFGKLSSESDLSVALEGAAPELERIVDEAVRRRRETPAAC